MTTLTKELALNLCDLGHQNNLAPEKFDEFARRVGALISDASARNGGVQVTRIYVGSYFCDRFFLSLNRTFHEALSQFARERELASTLVVPLFGQSALAAGRRRIEALLSGKGEPAFDEVVANDPAMALFVHEIAPQVALHYGRLMAKTHRDPRHVEMEAQAQGYALDKQQATTLKQQFGYALAEIDPTAPQVTTEALGDALPLALHLPHCFMTTGHICQAASDGVPAEAKFRPDAACRQQCLRAIQVYEHCQYVTDRPLWLTRAGRTVYFENPDCEITGPQPARIIWTPADFLCANAESAETWQLSFQPPSTAQMEPERQAAGPIAVDENGMPLDPTVLQPWSVQFEGGAQWA